MTRSFKTIDSSGKEVSLKLIKPNQKVMSDADFLFKKEFSRCIRNGLITNSEAFKIMKENGTWTDADDDAANKLREEIKELELKLNDSSLTEEAGKEVCDKLASLRDDLSSLNSRFNSITENTAENTANEMRLMYWAANCVLYEDGKRVFKDLENFISRSGEKIVQDSYKEAMLLNMELNFGITLSSNLADELPENKWKKALSEKTKTEVRQEAAPV